MHVALLEGRIGETPWGPRLGVRWWRFGAGVLLGLACRDQVVGAVLHRVLRADDAGVRRRGARQYRVPRPWLGTLRRDVGPSSYALGAHSVRRVPGVVCAVVRLGDGDQPPRGGPVDRPGRRCCPTPSGRCGTTPTAPTQFHCRADQRRGQPPPVGVQAVDVADVAAAGAVRDRPGERAGLRRAVVRQGRDAGRHAGDVVHRGAGAGVGGVAGVRQAGLALRRGPGRLLRGLPAVVRRHRPADVLLLRRDRWRRSWSW